MKILPILIILGVAVKYYNSDIFIVKDLICIGLKIHMLCPPHNVPKDKNDCVFCHKENIKSRLLYDDQDYVAFIDINPSAQLHFLVVPKDHLPSFDQLNHTHLTMIKRMKEIAVEILTNNSMTQIRIGFHLPPFNSIHHLHLHGIGRPFKNIFRALKYPPVETLWWTSVILT
jgi:diadenosine tetraphosphate (Ap4A) HIT family hydrolase